MSFFGLGYYHQHRFIAFPLLHVHAHATVKELGAQVQLTQTFGNEAQTPIEAVYVFPIPGARAAVTKFVMVKQDGTRIVGVVQEKAQAKATYDAAVAADKTASLMQQESPDVFQVSVGNIPPQEKVDIELTYSTELSEDEENDSIRFHLPVHIGARYGQGPSSTGLMLRSPAHFLPSNTTFLNVTISVESTSPISKIGCPSHTVSTELGPDPALANAEDLPFSNYARISLTSESALNKDFVLTIKSAGLDAPRCVAELHPKNESVALALSLVPRFTLPDLKSQEFIFLVDRSGSMHGSRIAAASKALTIMLRSLPHINSFFQIASFGSHSDMLWSDGSRSYNQETLDEATRHVDSMSANYGGTETRGALAMCFKVRKTDRPTSVFILTDGDAWDVNGVFEEVKNAVEAAPSKAYLRVYCLGIGNSASTAMCEGIARAGNGACMMVTEQESSITGKIARLLKAARTPMISDIKVDWGRSETDAGDDDFQMVSVEETVERQEMKKGKRSLNIFDQEVDPVAIDSKPPPPPAPVVLPPPHAVQTSPAKIRNLAPGVRLYAYAILKGAQVPKSVTLTGTTEDGSEIALAVPVTVGLLPVDSKDGPPALHAITARKIIQDLEDGRHDALIKATNEAEFAEDSGLLQRTVKAYIVRLGKNYSIVSSHTSFVAVDESGKSVSHPVSVEKDEDGEEDWWAEAHGRGQGRSVMPMSFGSLGRTGMTSDACSAPKKKRTASQGYAKLLGASASPPPQIRGGGAPDSALPLPTARAPAPMFLGYTFKSPAMRVGSAARPTPLQQSETRETEDPLERLARAQSFDGRFSLKVLKLVQVDESKAMAALPAGLEDEVIATVFAMAFIQKSMGSISDADEKAPWEGIFDKAKAYVEAMYSAGSVDDLVAQAAKVL